MDHPPEADDARGEPAQRFEELTGLSVEAAAEFVLTMALRCTDGRRPEAHDLAQETWVRIVARIVANAVEPVEHPKAWLGTSVRNVHSDMIRRGRAAKRLPAQQIRPLAELTAGDEPADEGRSPDDLAAARDLGHRVRVAVAALPREQRAVVELLMRGYSHSEIAELLDIPVGTSKTRFRLAATHLRGLPGLALHWEEAS